MKAVSLFAGVGGFDLAMQRVGIETVAAVEIDAKCRDVLAAHFPDTKLFEDVTKVGADELRATGFDARDGIITGGFPCQDVSNAGRRVGLAGSRSGLFWEIVRLADELKPRYLVLENVAGLLWANEGRDMGLVVKALVELGYGVCWRVLDAQYFGVPQRRRRVFFVCCLGDHRRPVEILFESDSSPEHLGAGRAKEEEIAAAVDTADRELSLAYGIQNTIINRSDLAGPTGAGYSDIGDPHYTLDTYGAHIVVTGKLQEPETCVVRKLTPLEYERLQGFSDGWTQTHSKTHRYKQMGNAVAVPVVEWIMRRLVACES